MAKKIERFTPRTRRTKYPYAKWFTGELMRLECRQDFYEDPRTVAASITAYARSKNIAAVALPIPVVPYRGSVEVWGDPSRTWDEGPTEEITDLLEAAGYDIKRRRSKGRRKANQ